MLKVKQQMEAEQALEVEKLRLADENEKGKKLAEESAEKGMAQLRAANPQWHMGYQMEAQEAKRLELTVTGTVVSCVRMPMLFIHARFCDHSCAQIGGTR